MLNIILGKVKDRLREPVYNYMYDFLMKPAKIFRGRRLFDAQELKLLNLFFRCARRYGSYKGYGGG